MQNQPGPGDGPAGTIRRVQQQSLVDQVAEELRRAILSGALQPASEISLRGIATELGVSFIPVREALRKLEAQGLVVTRTGRSALVAPLHRDELTGIYRLRRMIEPEIASRSSASFSHDDRTYFEQMLANMAAPATDFKRRYQTHQRFHLDLLRPVMTSWDLRIIGLLWDAAERYVHHAFDTEKADGAALTDKAEAHTELLEAMFSGDPTVAAAAWLAHLNRNERTALERIDGR